MVGVIYLVGMVLAYPIAVVIGTKSWADEFEKGRATFEGATWASIMAVPAALLWPLVFVVLSAMRVVNHLNEGAYR